LVGRVCGEVIAKDLLEDCVAARGDDVAMAQADPLEVPFAQMLEACGDRLTVLNRQAEAAADAGPADDAEGQSGDASHQAATGPWDVEEQIGDDQRLGRRVRKGELIV